MGLRLITDVLDVLERHGRTWRVAFTATKTKV